MQQINLKLPDNLIRAADSYVENFGFRNIQELATAAIREKIFEKNEYDETFSKEEVELVDELIAASTRKGDIVSEDELNKVLLG
jgi:metal-responsive CopG/Arc/MetJ family transcriptional regulator